MAEQSHTPGEPKTYELSVCKWEGRLRCVYLNDYRVAGGKPWGGASDMKTWNVTADDIYRAIPEMRRTPLEQAAPELLEALETALEYVAKFEDVRDGDYGVPEPNAAMTLSSELRAVIQKATGGSV